MSQLIVTRYDETLEEPVYLCTRTSRTYYHCTLPEHLRKTGLPPVTAVTPRTTWKPVKALFWCPYSKEEIEDMLREAEGLDPGWVEEQLAWQEQPDPDPNDYQPYDPSDFCSLVKEYK